MNFLLKAIAALALLGCAQAGFAQPSTAGLVPPRRITDGRGVDLISGQLLMTIPLVSFGEHATALSAWVETSPGRVPTQPGTFMNFIGPSIAGGLRPQAYTLGADGSPDEFGPYENIVFPTGAGFAQQLLQYPRGNPGGELSIHTNPDGSRYTHSFGASHFTRFQSADPNLTGVWDASGARGIIDPNSIYLDQFQKIVFADGEEWRFYREYISIPCSSCQVSPGQGRRLRFLVSSRGYGIQFLYVSDATPASSQTAGPWSAPRRITAYNKTSVYCDESLLQECAAVSALPSAEINYDSVAATVTMRQAGSTDGVELNLAAGTIRHTAVPNSAVSIEVAVENNGFGYVSRVTDSDGQWNYSHITYVDDSGHIPYMAASSTNPAGGTVGIFGYGIFGTIQTFTDELGRHYYYSDGFPFRDNGRSEPEADETMVGRDERNNITAIIRYPKPASGLPPVTLYTATYPVDCTNPRTCNRPTSTTDANLNVTDYEYASEHGGLTSETGPAVNVVSASNTVTSVRPQTRHEYAQRYAWISNGAGGYVHAATAIWLRTATSICRTSAATGNASAPCATAGDEVRTAYDYGPDSGPSNLLLRGQAVTSTDNGVTTTLRTCYGYDTLGRRISETRPNANLASCP